MRVRKREMERKRNRYREVTKGSVRQMEKWRETERETERERERNLAFLCISIINRQLSL